MTESTHEPDVERTEVNNALIEDVFVEIADEEVPLGSLMQDIQTAHEELSDYKNGGLVASQALDEKIAEATINGNDELKELLIDVKDSAFGVYLRVEYGDLELMGNRYPESQYHGYFSEE